MKNLIEAILKNRRLRFAELIERHETQAGFIKFTGESQSEVSGLLKNKSFGEKKARSIEDKCGLPIGWLDQFPGTELEILTAEEATLLADYRKASLRAKVAIRMSASALERDIGKTGEDKDTFVKTHTK